MGKAELEALSTNAVKISAIIMSGLITVITYLIKEEMTDVSKTLKSIQTNVQTVSKDNLLLNQKVDLRLENIEQNFNFRLDSIETKIETLHRK